MRHIMKYAVDRWPVLTGSLFRNFPTRVIVAVDARGKLLLEPSNRYTSVASSTPLRFGTMMFFSMRMFDIL
jgi:hypothetical protein